MPVYLRRSALLSMNGCPPDPEQVRRETSSTPRASKTVDRKLPVAGGVHVKELHGLDVAVLQPVLNDQQHGGIVPITVGVVVEGGGPRLVSLGGLSPRISRDRDHVDVGFLRLPQKLTTAIGEFKTFLRLDQVDLEHRPPEQGWYSILGFPRELSRINADQREP